MGQPGLQGDANRFYQFLCLTLPYADIGGYNKAFIGQFAEHAAFLLRTQERCRKIPESIFLWYVLHPRVNNEELSACRQFFYDELAARLEGLSPEDAVQEVNRWCAQHVTYRSTDERTASALSVWRTGYGRCGEESVFSVNAYRSVGIPARQVYAPWWSHCDDNHAWVEVWLDGQWRFLGACEPEPILDRGWFTEASSRVMMVHSKRFSRLPAERIRSLLEPGEEQNRIWDGSVLYDIVTGRYAETVRVFIRVRDGDRPVPHARVSLQVLNMASFRDLITLHCDHKGNAEIQLGKGSLRLCVSDGNRRTAVLIDTSDETDITLDLRQARMEPEGDFRMRAPKESLKNSTALTAGQKKSRNAVLEEAAEKRAAQRRTDQIPQELERIVRMLSCKDRNDIPADILRQHQAHMQPFENDYPADVFEKYLLCSRIGNEPLSLYAKAVNDFFSEEQKNRFRSEPAAADRWIRENIKEIGADLFLLPAKPGAVLHKGHGTAKDCLTLLAAILRSCGVPAFVKDDSAFYYRGGSFHPIGQEPDQAEILWENYHKDRLDTCSVCGTGDFRERTVSGWDAGNRACVQAGEYRLMAVNRLPNGDQLANSRLFTCKAGQCVQVNPEPPSAAREELLQQLPLDLFSLGLQGKETRSDELVRQGKRLFFWLDPGKEPTEHILNELLERSEGYRDMADALCLILEDSGQRRDPLLRRVLQTLGVRDLYIDGDMADQALIARRLYLEPDSLPLIMLMDGSHQVLYAAGGYNVGTAELLLRIRDAAFSFDKKRGTV